MKIKTLIKGGNFSEYQHFVVLKRKANRILPVGGGYPDKVCDRFGDQKIRHVSVYENIVRIEIKS